MRKSRNRLHLITGLVGWPLTVLGSLNLIGMAFGAMDGSLGRYSADMRFTILVWSIVFLAAGISLLLITYGIPDFNKLGNKLSGKRLSGYAVSKIFSLGLGLLLLWVVYQINPKVEDGFGWPALLALLAFLLLGHATGMLGLALGPVLGLLGGILGMAGGSSQSFERHYLHDNDGNVTGYVEAPKK